MATKRTYTENLELAKARGAAAKKAEPKAPAAKQLSLELWPDAVRGVPNAVLRGALFGVSQKRATHKKRTVIAAVDGYEIRFLGTTFNQTDLDVWETLLQLARLQPLGTKVEFTAHSILKELGRGTGKTQHEQLKEELARLGAGWTEITWVKEKKTFAGNLISSFFRDEETGRYVVKFNADMAQLYGVGHTLIDWAERQALGSNSLAKWLHGFYASHRTPTPEKVDTLRHLCGSKCHRLSDYRGNLRIALEELVYGGFLRAWHIDGKDKVHVFRLPQSSRSVTQ